MICNFKLASSGCRVGSGGHNMLSALASDVTDDIWKIYSVTSRSVMLLCFCQCVHWCRALSEPFLLLWVPQWSAYQGSQPWTWSSRTSCKAHLGSVIIWPTNGPTRIEEQWSIIIQKAIACYRYVYVCAATFLDSKHTSCEKIAQKSNQLTKLHRFIHIIMANISSSHELNKA